MTYAAYEGSRTLGAPINLYKFTCGTLAFRYTDHEFAVVLAGETFVPIPIDRGKITESGTMDKKTMQVGFPHTVEIANLFLAAPPSDIVTLKVWGGHADDPDGEFKVVWTGRVLSCSRKKTTAELTCEPISTSMKRNGLRRRYQFGCPFVLYGPDCKASKAAFSVSTTVAAISGSRIALPAGWTSRDPAKYLDGLVEWTNDSGNREVRTIKRVEGDGTTLLLSYIPRELYVGHTVSVVPGCNHKAGIAAQPDGDCGPVFGNILNFGGQPWIPFKNPIGLVNNYY